jgi:hypothetical protein
VGIKIRAHRAHLAIDHEKNRAKLERTDMKLRPITEQLLTRLDLARFLQVTTRTVDNLRGRGMPTIMVGTSPRFDKAAVSGWLRAEKIVTDAESVARAEDVGSAIRAFPDPNRIAP